MLNRWDTWHFNLESPYLESTTKLIEGAIDKPNIMNNFELFLFVSYELFPFPKFIYHMALQMNQYEYQINTYKELLVTNIKEYTPLRFVDYSWVAIINAFTIPLSWTNRMKKQVNLKKEAKNFKNNNIIMFDWITKCYDGNKDKLYPIYDTTLFIQEIDRQVI